MNIGIDIDDTITNSSEVFVKYAKEYNCLKNIVYSINTNELDQTLAFGWNDENKIEFRKLYLKKILTEVIPNKDVIFVLNYIKKCGYKIFLITARNENEISNMYEFTSKWLFLNKINYDKLIVNCNNKLAACKENKIGLFIDDNFKTCKDIYENSKIKVLLYTTKYNKNIDTDCMRVFNWREILLYIKSIKKV